jgi:hypothetical protein
MNQRRDVPGIRRYDHSAGGWDALRAVATALRRQHVPARGTTTLLRNNQPDGFDCPGCAWPDPKHTSSFEFCENGAKAVTWEATRKRVTPEFFAAHSVSELWDWSDFALEGEGRLTHPLAYDAGTDRFVPIAWDEAFARIGTALRALPSPDCADFYTSGRASNEAAFLFQIFARAFGSNNFPDCSNMCHEATSVGLPDSIGVGKGTVTLEDFDHADAIFSIGHNPGTNHPRMMTTLREASRRGVPIVVFNPLKERALERFASPQDPVEMARFGATQIASVYHQLSVGGDTAVLKGMMKRVLDRDAADLAAGGKGVLDRDFIAAHTLGFDDLRADLDATSWEDIEAKSGLARAALEEAGDIYVKAERVILCYGMGVTQHAREHRARGCGHMPVARPFQRAGRPYGGYYRKAGAGFAGGDRARVRLQAAGGAWARRGGERQGDDRRAVPRADLPRRQSGRGDAGPRGDVRGDAETRPGRAHGDQAQSLPSLAGKAKFYSAGAGAHRAGHAGLWPAIRHRGRFDVDGACLARHAETGFGAFAVGARGDCGHCQGNPAAAPADRLGRHDR